MHDPMILAFRARLPIGWRKKRAFNKERTVILDEDTKKPVYETVWWDIADIWHVDPERRGNDDSCGFSVPHLTKKQKERLKNFAWGEGRNPYFLRAPAKHWCFVPSPERKEDPQDKLDFDDERPDLSANLPEFYNGTMDEAEALYRGLLLQIANGIGIKMTYEQAAREAAITIHDPDCVHPADRFCYLPGWSTNFLEDTAERRQDHFYGLICGIARWMLIDRRPWYRHPRWHLHHWKVNVAFFGKFKRWLFSRCAHCRKRFSWGYYPISHQWYGDGPCWFRGERGVFHFECDRAMDAAKATSGAAEAAPGS